MASHLEPLTWTQQTRLRRHSAPRGVQRSTAASSASSSSDDREEDGDQLASDRSHRHRHRPPPGSIPVPMASPYRRGFETSTASLSDAAAVMATNSRALSTSPSDDGDEDDDNTAPQSASYFRPRTLAGYTRYLEYVSWL